METMNFIYSDYRAPILISPGDILQDFLDDYSMTQKDLSNRIGVSKTHINQIVRGIKPLTQDMAEKLSIVFNTTSIFWMNLEVSYRSRLAEEKEIIVSEEEKEIIRQIPYSELSKRGYVEETGKVILKIREARKFYMVADLARIENTYPAYRKSSTKKDHTYSLLAWQRIGEIKAQKIKSDPLNLSKLRSVISKLREVTLMNPDTGFDSTVTLLNSIGIIVVLEEHFSGSGINGMVFFPSKQNKAIVLLSIRNRYFDTFWFTLMHELAHLLLYHERKIPLHGLSDEIEDEVNVLAGNLLLPQDKFHEFLTDGDFSLSSIKKFSSEIGVHPCIVIGRLQHERKISFSHYNAVRPKLQIK